MTSLLTTFPATRTTNKSPSPWSKMSSGGTRESAHACGEGSSGALLMLARQGGAPPGELPPGEQVECSTRADNRGQSRVMKSRTYQLSARERV